VSIVVSRSDHDSEFENENFQAVCENYGINHNFYTPRTKKKKKKKKKRLLRGKIDLYKISLELY